MPILKEIGKFNFWRFLYGEIDIWIIDNWVAIK